MFKGFTFCLLPSRAKLKNVPEEIKKERDLEYSYKVWIPLVFAISAILGLVGGYKMANRDAMDSLIIELEENQGGNTGRVEELIRFIESRYVFEVNSDELIEDAFENVLENLDPHSVYLHPSEMELLNDQMEGSFEGIGIESILLNDTLFVNHVLKDGPASKSGLMPGDQVIAINDSIIAGKDLKFNEIKSMLKGSIKDKIKLDVIAFDNGELKSVDIEIDNVDIKTAEGFLYNNEIAVVRINRFSSDSYQEFMMVLEEITKENNFNSLILDLRGNPGGFLPEATKILNQIFREKGKLLVYTQGRNERVSEYKSTGKNFYNIEKVAILVDEGSASGSEIIAGAIQDWDRGLIVGRRTFGKGLVQEQYDLSNGGALRLTVAEYFTPSGRLIQKSYKDKDDYRNDISNRISSGELAGNLDMPVMDSTEFKTKIENRTVYGGGGITPDIYIPSDSVQMSYENISAKSKVSEFVFLEYRKRELKVEMEEEEFLKNWTASEELIRDFRGYLGFNEANYQYLEDYLKEHLKVEIAKLFYGNKSALQAELIDDEYVTQSINALSKRNIFAELKN